MMTKGELIAFEDEIAQLFNEGKIRSPIHLSRNNEEQLIKIFREVGEDDWVFATHRNHYAALLKGIPKEWLKQEILANRSIHINNAKYNFFSSAIVAGICPIAVGVAYAIKRQCGINKVWCFVGDMAARTGIFYESVRYAEGFDLPVTFIVEDNHYSVNTKTVEVWGENYHGNKVMYYEHERDAQFGHSGTGKYIRF